jgi:NAD(P)H-hydrate epimerase
LGDLIIANIGIPQEAEQFTGPGDVYLVNKQRKKDDYKGMLGTLLVIGGTETYTGAPSLTSLAAYAVGIDLVYTAVPESISQVVSSFSPSLITLKLTGNNLNQDNLEEIEPFLNKVDAVAIGPGLGLSDDTMKAVNKLIKMIQNHHLPCLIDADGLKAYAENKKKLKTRTIFTPHAKEFSILTGKEATGDFLEKGEIVRKEAEKLRAVILLKGSIDIISDGKFIRYNLTGNPGMTVGGTGDVLSGVTAGFMAQGAEPMNAACAGAFINGAAGDFVYKKKGYHILPEDIINEIPITIENALKYR